MRNLLPSFSFLLALSAVANPDVTDLAKDAATVMVFQAAVASYDEAKAMSFIAPDAELLFQKGNGTEQKSIGRDAIQEAYAKNWFQISTKMVSLDEASFSRTAVGEFRYAFKGTFMIEKNGEWEKSDRRSVTYFTVSDGKIVRIRRFQ